MSGMTIVVKPDQNGYKATVRERPDLVGTGPYQGDAINSLLDVAAQKGLPRNQTDYSYTFE